MPQLITVVYPCFQSQKRTRPQTMAGSTVDWELSRGMIGACVSKLRVVSWITIDWHKIAKHRMRTGNGSATMRSGETRVSGCLRSITGPAVNIVYAKTSVVVVRPIYSRACVYLYQGGAGHAFAFHASVHVAPGRPVYIDTDVSIRSSWHLPLLRKRARLVPAHGPGVPIKRVLP